MVTFQELNDTPHSKWKTAADDWMTVAQHALRTAQDLREQGAAPLRKNWADAVGLQASLRFMRLADRFESAYDLMMSVHMVAEGLASTVELAQRTLRTAQDLADSYGFTITTDGQLEVPPPHNRMEAEDIAPYRNQVQEMIDEALRQANEADALAVPELDKLRLSVDVSDPDKALNEENEASHVQMRMLGADLPKNQDAAFNRAWWDGLTAKEQQQMMLAEPVGLSALPGIPESAKREMRGTDGKIDRVKMVQYALDHWNKPDDTEFSDNCTNFASEALLAGGMHMKTDSMWGPRGDNTWMRESGIGIDAWDSHLYFSHSWGGAENLQDFLLKNGGEEVPQSQARPGDLIFFEQQGPGYGPAAPGNTHHTAIVTAVTPDGDIKYTQHTDSYQNVSLQGRLPSVEETDGQQRVRIVRPHPNWY